MKQNGYWMVRLQAARMLGRDPVVHVLERQKRIDAVTPAMLKDTFVTYFPMDRYTVVTLVPEGQ
jgi:predicted Zn-dependent peptidase